MKTALLIGSTGLVGSQLLHLLLDSSTYNKVIVFVKRDAKIEHPKLVQHIIDFDHAESYEHYVHGDDFFCCIGTTIKKAGSQEAFKKVDYTYPKQFAQLAAKNKVSHLLLISSIGADEKSTNFYLKTKGAIEAFLKIADLETVTIVRPSLLLGKRTEFRLTEKIGAFFMTTFSFLLVGNLKKYKPIESKKVAQALYKLAQDDAKGFRIFESDQMQEL